jgi:hypothetical protein
MISLEIVPNGYGELIKRYGYPANADGTQNVKWALENIKRFKLKYPLVGIAGEQVDYLPFHIFVGDSVVDALAEARELMANMDVVKYNDVQMEVVGKRDEWPDWNQTAGSTVYRFNKNSPRHLSTHAWGIAVDLNSTRCPNGSPSPQHPIIIECFRKRGWIWINPTDNMHVQACTGY